MSPAGATFTESVVEEATLEWLADLGYTVLHGPGIAFGEPAAERDDSGYRDVVLERRLRQALERLNPALPPAAIEDAYKRLSRLNEPSIAREAQSRAAQIAPGRRQCGIHPR